MATKIFKKLNDASVNETWAPILEGYGVDAALLKSRPWLVDLAHYRAIHDNSGAINESVPGLFLQQPGSISAMGNIHAPTNAMTPFSGMGSGTLSKGSMANSGSGDKFPSLLPVAIQVAAKTIGFDLVGVVPMDAPVGFIPYLDYVYQGGNIDNQYEPFVIKIENIKGATAFTTGGGTFSQCISGDLFTITDGTVLTLSFIGFSRVDGVAMFKVVSDAGTGTVLTDYIADTNTLTSVRVAGANSVRTFTLTATTIVGLASALENHISGFTTVSDTDYADTNLNSNGNFSGPYLGANGTQQEGMLREVAEVSKFRQMGLKMFTKFIEAKGDQVAISATVEQIQDLNRVWNFDVISMLENVAVNEVAQSINKKLVDRVFALGAKHVTDINAIEGAGICDLNLTVGSGFENISTLQRRVVTKILEMANLIYHRGRFGAGTHVVTNGRVASALADVAGYTFAPFNNDLPSGVGQLYPAGKVHGLTVYVDPNLKFGDNRIHIGRKGADEEPGVKFLPYIMAESLQTIAEGTFSPKIGLKSRYAITEAGWHPETQYITLAVTGLGVLTGSVSPSTGYAA
jgi:hypothetical protein